MWTMVFFIMGAAGALGIFIGLLFFPLMIYAVPYELWVEAQQKQYNIPKDIPSKHMSIPKKTLFNAKNATKFYYSKITKKPHNITKF